MPLETLNVASLWSFKHRWSEMGGLRFITIWQDNTIIGVSSEANHHVQAFVAMKNAGITSGHDDLEDADWVYKWQAFLDHFSPEKSSRWDSAWCALPEEQLATAAVLGGVALMCELEQRTREGFTWQTPVQEVIDRRLQSYRLSEDESSVVRVGDGR